MIYEEDVIRYNEPLTEVCAKMCIPVNDLYEFVMAGEPSRIMQDDGILFTERGYELLGERVSDAIRVFIDR
jgi:lysophospholipase L1-like esterase